MKTLTLTEGGKTVMTIAVRDIEFDGGTLLATVDLNGAVPNGKAPVRPVRKRRKSGRGPDRKPRVKRIGNCLTAAQVGHIKWLLGQHPRPAELLASDYYQWFGNMYPQVTMHTIRDIHLKRSWARVRAKEDPAGPHPSGPPK